MSKKKKSNQKGQTINLGDAASPHIGSGDADEREKKYEQPLGVKLERCSKMKDERPKRKGAMYMVTVPTVSPLFELCRQRGFFFLYWAEIFFPAFSPPPYSHNNPLLLLCELVFSVHDKSSVKSLLVKL